MKDTLLTKDWAEVVDILSAATKSKNNNTEICIVMQENFCTHTYQLKAYLSHKSNPKMRIEIKLFK